MPSGRQTLVLGVVMLGWLFMMMALSAFGGGSGPGTAAKVTIDQGVEVTPANGWTSGADVWNVGPGAVSLKKSGAVVVFAAAAYSGSAEALLTDQIDQLRAQFDSFRTLSSGPVTVSRDIPGVIMLFSGTSGGGQEEGELAAVSVNGTGVVMLAIAPFGQLRSVQDDIDQMLDTLVIP